MDIFENWLLHLVKKIIAVLSFTIAQFDYVLTFSLCSIFSKVAKVSALKL